MQIDDFYATLLQQGRADGKGGLSAKSVLYIHRVLNEALGHAVQKGLLVKNPLLSVTNISKAKKFKASAYSTEEIHSLLEAAAAENSFWQAAIALAAICGLRRGECLGLKWSKIDFDNQSITIDEQIIEIHHKVHFSQYAFHSFSRFTPFMRFADAAIRRCHENSFRNPWTQFDCHYS